jgi:hypothetical protein
MVVDDVKDNVGVFFFFRIFKGLRINKSQVMKTRSGKKPKKSKKGAAAAEAVDQAKLMALGVTDAVVSFILFYFVPMVSPIMCPARSCRRCWQEHLCLPCLHVSRPQLQKLSLALTT